MVRRVIRAVRLLLDTERGFRRDCHAAVEQMRAERLRNDAMSAIAGTANADVDRALDRIDGRRP